MAAAEIVYDSATPSMVIDNTNVNNYSARIIRPLDRRETPFSLPQMAEAGFTPAADTTMVVAERWYFKELPGSLQRRFYYDSLAEKLVFRGYLNDKESGDGDLTVGPDPVNILEPNVMTSDEKTKVLGAVGSSGTQTEDWTAAVTTIYDMSRNPNPVRVFNNLGQIVRAEIPVPGGAASGGISNGMKEIPAVTLNDTGLPAAEVTRLNRLNTLFAERNWATYEPNVARSWVRPPLTWVEMLGLAFGIRPPAQTNPHADWISAEDELLSGGAEWVNDQLTYVGSPVPAHEQGYYVHLDSLGVGSALVPNPALLTDPINGSHYITIAENNRSELDGAPVSLHIIEIIPDRYRGALKVIEGADPFSEKVTIQHNGEFGGNTQELYYEWWIRDATSLSTINDREYPEIRDNGTLADVDSEGSTAWQKYLPKSRTEDSSLTLAQKHWGLHTIVFEGSPDVTLGDKLILMRYKHRDEPNWNLVEFEYTDAAVAWAPAVVENAAGDLVPVAGASAPFQWAGAANSPQMQADGSKRFIPQLVMGWVKRILDRINPYEARYTDFFSTESPNTNSSQIQIAGGPYAGPVALNPDKDVIENVGLIELYETVLERAKSLSIDNSSNPSTSDSIGSAILLAATRLSVLYELLAGEAYIDAQDPTITVTGGEFGLREVASFTHSFQNLEASLQHEELALLRGTDFRKSYPVFNRMFWNYTKGLGEAAYNVNYNINDENVDGFINEDDARSLFPQGHGDAWGHHLSALGMHYELLQQPVFQWNSRAELYSLMENVLEVDYLDERTFARNAAAKARTGADILRNTYRLHYTEDPDGQWQGYTDTDPARAWGVSGWAHRTGQAAYFDWAIANAILPEEAENAENLDRIQRSVGTDEIGLLSGGLLEVQTIMDEANSGMNPLSFDTDALTFDLNPEFYENASGGEQLSHFEQIHARAVEAARSALGILLFNTRSTQKLRNTGDDADSLIRVALEQDLDFRNDLIEIFGRPYDGLIGIGKPFPEGYVGPDTLLYAYLDRTNVINTNPSNAGARATTGLIPANFNAPNRDNLTSIRFEDIQARIHHLGNNATAVARFNIRDNGDARQRLLTQFTDSRRDLAEGSELTWPVERPRARSFAYKAPVDGSWGARASYGLLQTTLEEMLAEEIAYKSTADEYVGFLGDLDAIATTLMNELERMRDRGQIGDAIVTTRAVINSLITLKKIVKTAMGAAKTVTTRAIEAAAEIPPSSVGFSFDVGAPIRGGIRLTETGVTAGLTVAEKAAEIAEFIATLVKEEVIASLERDVGRIKEHATIEGSVSYTHLTQPTKRIV